VKVMAFFPKNFSVGDALHVIRVERIGLASQVVIISPRIKSINDISLEEVKVSLVPVIPSAVKAEILREAGEGHVGLGRSGGLGWYCGGSRGRGWERSKAGSGVNVLLGANVKVLVGLGAAALQAESARLPSSHRHKVSAVFLINIFFHPNASQ